MTAALVGPVCFFLPNLEAGGAERVMLDLAEGLHHRGHEISVVVGCAGGGLSGGVAEGVATIDLEAERTRYAAGRFAGYLRRERPACVLATLDHSAVLALVATRLVPGRIPVIVRVANTLSSKSAAASGRAEKATFALAKRLYPRADLLITPSQGVADDLCTFAPVDRGRVVVIPNPVVDRRLFDRAAEPPGHPWFGPGLPPVVLAVGRLVPQKDFQVLMRAFRKVRSGMECRLLILGEGPEREALSTLSRELGIDDDVDLPGFTPNPFSCMAAAGAFVLSSRYEGLPGVLIQALACGAPVVSTNCPSGPEEILAGGRYGRLVPVGDSDALAGAIEQALAGPTEKVPDEAWLRYSLERSLDGYELALARVAGGRR
jgi:glycosyltransferase involved in cell wall biosynthesis